MPIRLACKARNLKESLEVNPLFLACLIVALFSLSACNIASISRSNVREKGSSDVRREKLVKEVNVNDARDIATPASSAEGFSTQTPRTTIGSALPPPGMMGDTSPPQTLKLKGLKMERLFDETLRDEDDRFDRLEGSVQNMHNYLATLSPSIERLVAIEGDIQVLVEQLETLLNEDEPYTDPKPIMDLPLKTIKQSKTSSYTPPYNPPYNPVPLKNTYGAKTLARVRASTSPQRTRIVFDLSEKMKFSYDLDQTENILTFIFPEAKSSSIVTSSLARSKLFKNMSVTPQDGEGYIVALDLARDVSVVKEGKLPPTQGNSMYRVYLDLK